MEIRSTPGAVPATLRSADLTGVTTLVLHAGTNCLANDDPNLERTDATQIAKEVTTKLDELRRLNTDTELIYSSILTRHDIGERDKSKVKIHELIDATNAIIETHCNIHNFKYISNANIQEHDLYDGLHCNEDGAAKLAKNIANAIKGKHQQTSDTRPTNNRFIRLQTSKIGARPSARYKQRNTQLGDYWPTALESAQAPASRHQRFRTTPHQQPEQPESHYRQTATRDFNWESRRANTVNEANGFQTAGPPPNAHYRPRQQVRDTRYSYY